MFLFPPPVGGGVREANGGGVILQFPHPDATHRNLKAKNAFALFLTLFDPYRGGKGPFGQSISILIAARFTSASA